MFVAFLDTCVLWPSLQRDFLLSLGVEGVFRPIWSEAVLAELEHHEAEKLVKRGEERGRAQTRSARLVDQMRRSFADAIVHGWEPLEGSFGLPDPGDEHVVAAAQIGGAGAIVTHNLRDFPRSRVPRGIDVLEPAEFAHQQVALNPAAGLRALDEIAGRSGRHGPSLSAEGVVDVLESRYGMAHAARILRNF